MMPSPFSFEMALAIVAPAQVWKFPTTEIDARPLDKREQFAGAINPVTTECGGPNDHLEVTSRADLLQPRLLFVQVRHRRTSRSCASNNSSSVGWPVTPTARATAKNRRAAFSVARSSTSRSCEWSRTFTDSG